MNELQKISKYSLFIDSKILTEFLIFIVHETISGRADRLKEYTIAVQVLKRSVDFRPGDDGIVRVHARRLRDALDCYYEDPGVQSICEISIPKGAYVPAFKYLKKPGSSKKYETKITENNFSVHHTRIAIFPFTSFDPSASKLAFIDGVSQMLHFKIANFSNISVLANYSTKCLQEKQRRLPRTAFIKSVRYMITGTAYFHSSKTRFIFQLIDAATECIVWAKKYTYDFDRLNLFKLEDLIVGEMISDLKNVKDSSNNRIFKNSISIPMKTPLIQSDSNFTEPSGIKRAISF